MNSTTLKSDNHSAVTTIDVPFLEMDINDGVYMGIGFALGILLTLAFVHACKKMKSKKTQDDFV